MSPQSWLSHLLGSDPELIAGEGDIHQNLQNFWSCYGLSNGHHSVFTSRLADRLDSVVPILVHGDEGRGLKRSKQMIFSLQSVLGSTPKPAKRQKCVCKKVLQSSPSLPVYGGGDDAGAYTFPEGCEEQLKKQATNYRGSTFISRWLLFTIGGWVYRDNPEILDGMVAQVARDLCSLFTEGILVGTKRFFGACIGVKGDLDFHRQLYSLLRSYAHVGTKYTGQICHACLAGGTGPAFEDYSELPQWVPTLFQSRPWDANSVPPVLSTIPGFPAPEELIRLDVFHIIKMGLGRSIVGGVLVYLAKHGGFDYPECTANFKDRLARAHGSFSLWCCTNQKHPALRSFSKEFFNMRNFQSAPWSNSKGSDTTLLLHWLSWYVTKTLRNPSPSMDPGLLRMMLKLLQATTSTMQMCHNHNLWLSRACARRLYVDMVRMLRGYQLVGSMCLQKRYRAFIQKPKNHALHHIAWTIRSQLAAGAPYIINPEADSCECDEDYVGRIARLSRKVNVRLQGHRVFSRLFLKVRAVRKRWRQSRKGVVE